MDVSSATASTSRALAFLSNAAETATRTRLSIEESFTLGPLGRVDSVQCSARRADRRDRRSAGPHEFVCGFLSMTPEPWHFLRRGYSRAQAASPARRCATETVVGQTLLTVLW